MGEVIPIISEAKRALAQQPTEEFPAIVAPLPGNVLQLFPVVLNLRDYIK